MLNASWHIRSRSRKCALSGEPFTDGETIVTALFPDPESSGYLRQDFSLASWQSRTDDAEPPFSSWRTTFNAADHEEKPDPMKREDPESLLRRLVEEDEDHTENVRYILAIMLERQKLLRETDSQPVPNGILRVYEHRKTGEAFIIRDPNIPLDQVEKVQEEVILLLENNGRQPAPGIEPSPDAPLPEPDPQSPPSDDAPDAESPALKADGADAEPPAAPQAP